MSKILHRNKLFSVEELDIGTGKDRYNFYAVNKADEVVVLPFISKNDILIEEQYRPVVKEHFQELPAGLIEKNEKPEAAARRELEEETGYKARNMKLLVAYYTSPGFLNVVTYLYLATGLYKGKVSLDEHEELTVKRISYEKALRFASTRKIADQKTIFALLYYKFMV